jgi:hypothetical protein
VTICSSSTKPFHQVIHPSHSSKPFIQAIHPSHSSKPFIQEFPMAHAHSSARADTALVSPVLFSHPAPQPTFGETSDADRHHTRIVRFSGAAESTSAAWHR